MAKKNSNSGIERQGAIMAQFAREAKANEVLKSAKAFPGSYRILFSGKGNADKIEQMKSQFSNYRFV